MLIPRAEPVLSPALALVLGATAAVLGWRGGDLPAQLFRIDLVRQHGLTLWNNQWYGGHFTLGYSVLSPVLGAIAGPVAVGLASAVTASLCFDRLVRARAGSRATVASLLFAAGTVTNLAVGRLAFALGLALGLAALLAAESRHKVLAVLLTVACPLASPVAGAFLALAWTAWALSARRWQGGALAGAALAPVLLIAVLFPVGGTFPYRWPSLLLTVCVCAGVWLLLPREQAVLRFGTVLYGAAALLTFLLPTPVGANVNRLGMFVAAPLLVAFANRRLLVVLGLPVLLLWQWTPAVDAIVRSGNDPSTHREYYAGLLAYLNHAQEPSRVEIPFTKRHFESYFVASQIPIARGWERQLDIDRNPLFYADVLSVQAYHDWLQRNGVRYVALPDAELDASARAEGALLQLGLPYLRPAWHDDHWRVWEVVGATGMLDGPGELLSMDAEQVVLKADRPGDLLVRVHHSQHWALEGDGCIAPGLDGWLTVRAASAGVITLRSSLGAGWSSGPQSNACASD